MQAYNIKMIIGWPLNKCQAKCICFGAPYECDCRNMYIQSVLKAT